MSSEFVTDKILGNFVGPLVFKTKDAPRYAPAFLTVTITAILAAVTVIIYRYICVWQNNKRDKAGIAEAFDHAYEDDLTDLKVCNHIQSHLFEPFRLHYRIEPAVQICSLRHCQGFVPKTALILFLISSREKITLSDLVDISGSLVSVMFSKKGQLYNFYRV
jgi:hypothetical protein